MNTGTFGMGAALIIAASGFGGRTELGYIPEAVHSLASLPDPVRLVLVDSSLNFKLSANNRDRVRSDTSLYRWLADVSPSVVETPEYFLPGNKPFTFQLLKRVAPPPSKQFLVFLRLVVKFVPARTGGPAQPELWISTAVPHSDNSARIYIAKAVSLTL